jgi:type II secretory pathway component PulF
MELPPSQGKIAALRQIAVYYWDRNQNTGDWWIHWLIAFFLWMVGIAVLCAIVSLFMPLIAIVSGLTSSK